MSSRTSDLPGTDMAKGPYSLMRGCAADGCSWIVTTEPLPVEAGHVYGDPSMPASTSPAGGQSPGASTPSGTR